MPRLFRVFGSDVAWLGVSKCLEDKWRRNDVRTFIEEWTGYSRYELLENELENGSLSYGLKYEILCSAACSVEDMVEGILHGIDPDFDPVSIRKRPDGATGKIRDVAYLCIRHQLLGHVVKIGLEPLLKARILPTQHASIPKRGQAALTRQIRRILNRRLGVTVYAKTDCTSAYKSTTYDACIKIIRKEIPRAKWILACMAVLKRHAPDGHLIIGGYLDAWLFNLVISYAMRYALSLEKTRREKRIPMIIRIVGFMDDLWLAGRSETALMQSIKQIKAWLWGTFHIALRTTTDVIRLYPIMDEKRRKREGTAAKRSVPMVDMGGFKIAHSFVTIRRRNVPRIIRTFDRALAEYKRTGTIKRQRACQIIARNGMVKNTDSLGFCGKHHVFEVLRIAKKVQAYWAREARRKRKERIAYVVEKYRERCAALYGSAAPA